MLNPPGVDRDGDHAGVEQHLDAGFLGHELPDDLEVLRVIEAAKARPIAIHLADDRREDIPQAIQRGEPLADAPGGGDAAQAVALFDQQDAAPVPRGSDRRGAAGRSPARHQHLHLQSSVDAHHRALPHHPGAARKRRSPAAGKNTRQPLDIHPHSSIKLL